MHGNTVSKIVKQLIGLPEANALGCLYKFNTYKLTWEMSNHIQTFKSDCTTAKTLKLIPISNKKYK